MVLAPVGEMLLQGKVESRKTLGRPASLMQGYPYVTIDLLPTHPIVAVGKSMAGTCVCCVKQLLCPGGDVNLARVDPQLDSQQ